MTHDLEKKKNDSEAGRISQLLLVVFGCPSENVTFFLLNDFDGSLHSKYYIQQM